MAYIYDILLNFNSNLIDFYEWNDIDNIKYIRKILLFKINKTFMDDILKYDIEISEEFIKKIKDTASFYNNLEKDYNHLCLLSDGYFVIGIKFKNNKIELISKLQLDEEEEVLKITDKLNPTIINYKKISKKENEPKKFFTRKELEIKKLLKDELSVLYKNNKKEELIYYYYEYFNKKIDDCELMYYELLNSMENTITEKHYNLFKIIKLIEDNKNQIC